MVGLEDAWPRLYYFLHIYGHSKLFIFDHRKNLTSVYHFFKSSVLVLHNILYKKNQICISFILVA